MNKDERKGWRALLALVRRHPELAPTGMYRIGGGVKFSAYRRLSDRGEALAALAAAGRAMAPCRKEKGFGGGVTLVKDLGGGVSLSFTVHGACERVVKGTRTIAAREAYEEEVIEWSCPPSVLAGDAVGAEI